MKYDSKSMKSVIDFMNKNFNENKCLANYRKLIVFLEENKNIKLSEAETDRLLSLFPILYKTIDASFDLIDERILLDNKSIENLISSYRTISLKEIDEKAGKEDSLGNVEKEMNITDKFNNDLDLFKIYVNEVKQYPLLTKEDEQRLGLEIKKGNEDARNELIRHNLKLVIYVAKHYTNEAPLGDLIQEGNLGLIKAAQKFDIDKGCKFSTYATWWIRQTIKRAIAEKGREIRVPVHQVENLKKMVAIENNYVDEHNGEEPSVEKLSELTGFTTSRIDTLKKMTSTVSLSTPVGSSEDYTLEDIIEDKNAIDFDENIFFEQFREDLENTTCISQRDLEILKYRFGFIDGMEHTLEETGEIYRVTRERIRQVEAKACSKLAKDPRIKSYSTKYMNTPSYNRTLAKRNNSNYAF